MAINQGIRNDEFSSVTPWTYMALKMYQYTYGLLPGVVVDVELDSHNFRVRNKFKNWFEIAWTSIVTGIAIIAMCVIGLLVADNLFHFQAMQMSLFQAVICNGILVCIVSMLATITVFRTNRFLYNYLNNFFRNELGFRFRRNTASFDLPGFLLVYFMTGAIFFGLPLPVLLWYLELDPIQVFLERFILSKAYFRGNLEIVFSTIFSLIGTMIGFYIIVKIVFLALVTPIFMGISADSFFYTLTSDALIYSENEFISHFVCLRILCMLAREFISYLTLDLVTWSQFFLTGCAWISVHGFQVLPIFVVTTTSAAFVGGLGMAICILHNTTNARLLSIEIIDRQKNRWYTLARSKMTYYYFVKWKAQQPLPINCGQNFALSKDAIMNYLDVLSVNVTNAVLLIQP